MFGIVFQLGIRTIRTFLNFSLNVNSQSKSNTHTKRLTNNETHRMPISRVYKLCATISNNDVILFLIFVHLNFNCFLCLESSSSNIRFKFISNAVTWYAKAFWWSENSTTIIASEYSLVWIQLEILILSRSERSNAPSTSSFFWKQMKGPFHLPDALW